MNEKEMYWREMLRTHEISGLSLKQFCRSRNLSYEMAKYWRNKFQETLPRKCESKSADFIEIPMSYPQSPQEKLILHLNSGAVLEIPSGFDSATLRSTINILREVRSC